MTPQVAAGWYLGRLRRRVRERNFWLVQAGLVTVTLIHTVAEATETLAGMSGTESLVHVPVTLYLVPIVYAGIHYGREGGVLTAAAAAVLTTTNVVLWHRDGYEWLGEVIFLGVVISLSLVIAFLAERQQAERVRAERSRRKLHLLTSVSGMLSRDPGVGRSLAMVLSVMREALELDTARVLPARPGPLPPGEIDVPVRSASTVLATLRVRFRGREPSEEETELLASIAAQMATALENDRLRQVEHERLRTYAQRVTEAQEEERRRIARDLHDDIAQSLIVLCRSLERAEPPIGWQPGTEDVLCQAQAVLRDVRRFGRNLRPQLLDDLGLVPALEAMVADLYARTAIEGRVTAEGPVGELPPPVALALFRVAQEAIKNVEKHAEAPWARIDIRYRAGRVRMTVADGGRGFVIPPDDGDGGERWGLLGMEERMKLLGGTFELSSAPGRGTEVTTELAVEQKSPTAPTPVGLPASAK